MNNSNITVSTVANFDKIFVSVFYWTISGCGLYLHTLVLIATTFRSKANQGSQNFNFFLHNLCIADCLHYLLYVLYAAPCVLMSSQLYGTFMGYYWGLFENINFIAIVLLTFIISVNRAVSLSQSDFLSKMFETKFCYCMIVFSWIIGVLVVVADTNWTTCRIVFDETKFYFSYFCTDPKRSPTETFSMVVIYLGVFSVALVYGITILIMLKQRNSISDSNQQQRSNMNRYKNRLLYQALIIWLSLVINVLSFIVVPMLLSGLTSVVVEGLFVLMQSMVTPICMLFFSKDTRSAVKNLLMCKKHVELRTTTQIGKTV